MTTEFDFSHVASQIAAFHRAIASTQIDLSHAREKVRLREIQIFVGVDQKELGPNAEARKLATAQRKAEDAELAELCNRVMGLETQLMALEGERDAAIALRRGGEWGLRQSLVQQVERSGTNDTTSVDGASDNAAFDPFSDVHHHEFGHESFYDQLDREAAALMGRD